MPEMPEVETIRRDLEVKIINRAIEKIVILNRKTLKNSTETFKKNLMRQSFEKICRRGKLLILKIKKREKFLLIHLKMTGQLIYLDGKEIILGGHGDGKGKDLENLPNRFTRVQFVFKDGGQLFFNDLRKFGYLKVIGPKELAEVLVAFGIEPLTKHFTFANFSTLFKKSSQKVKALLLSQARIAGLGNIYADESLFLAKIRPDRKANSLSVGELKRLFAAIKKVMVLAIKLRGTTFNNYVDTSGKKGGFLAKLKVYGRKGEPCPSCGEKLVKIKMAGRGTHYCPHCQK